MSEQEEMTPGEAMRSVPTSAFAAALIRQLADFMDRGDVRLTDFKNNVFGKDKGMISISWEATKHD